MSANTGYYDPPLKKNGQQTTGDNRTGQLQEEIDAAVDQMRQNISAAGQRGENLDALQTKTDDLATSANGFRRGANRVRKQMWWKDMKMRMCIIIGIIVLLLIIIIPSVVYSNRN